MFRPMYPSAIVNSAESLAKAIHALTEYPALVEQMNTLEESLPKRDQEPKPGGSARVAALRRRWLLMRDAACVGAARVLHRCAGAVEFVPGLRQRLSKFADRVERLCPFDLVDFCGVCEARELITRMMFAGDRAVCEACIRDAIVHANALRLPGEPVMTEAFVHELLSLHRVPHWRLDGWQGDASPVVEARDAQDIEIHRARMIDLGALGETVCKRWLVAIAPIAVRLETFADISRAGGRESE